MKQHLLDTFNEEKNTIAEVISKELKAKGNKVTFNPPIRIDFPHTDNEDFETITEIEFNEKENSWYVHNFITDLNLQADEYWTPLRDLTFEELYNIAEKL